MFARKGAVAAPEVGEEAPAFNLPSAQGGQLRSSMRTARGPVVVVFYEGPTEEEVAYFADLASKEDEINMAAGSIVGIGIAEPDEARDFVEKTGIKSYVLYDYAGIATREYGLLEKSKEHGEYASSATFIVGADHRVVNAWLDERPKAEEILAKVSEITGLPKPVEEEADGDEKSRRAEAGEERKRPSPEERERRRAERRAAREKGEKPADKDAPKPESKTESEPAEGG